MNMLETWKNSMADRRVIEEFLEYLECHHHYTKIGDLHADEVLDSFFGISRSQLEAERRKLLESLQ